MELREPIEQINELLIAEFGREFNGQAKFRVVFSEDQFEKRFTNYTDDGFELLFPEVRELPKYKQHIHQRYILERLIPIIGETDLTTAISYEPAWIFQDNKGNYLPPWFDGCKFIIEAMYSAMNKEGNHVKYKDPHDSLEERELKLKKIESELFGNETETGDHLAHGTGIVNKFEKEETVIMTKQETIQ